MLIILLSAPVVFSGGNLEAGLKQIQSHRTYQEFYDMPDWANWTAGEKAGHITAKVFDMEKKYDAEISQLRQELARQEALNQKRADEQRQMLVTIVLLLQKR